VVALDEVDHAHEDVVERDGRVFTVEFPKVRRILEGGDLRVVSDHVVLGSGGIGVIVRVNDLVEAHSTARFHSGDDGSIDEIFARGIR